MPDKRILRNMANPLLTGFSFILILCLFSVQPGFTDTDISDDKTDLDCLCQSDRENQDHSGLSQCPQNIEEVETLITPTDGQNDGQRSLRNKNCQTDLMLQCQKEYKKNQGRVKAEDPIIKREKYIKCLTNHVSEIIYTDFPELPLKFKKTLKKRVDEFNLRIRNMFAELYCKSDGSSCKNIMDSRAIENIERISEDLLQTPFMNMEECR